VHAPRKGAVGGTPIGDLKARGGNKFGGGQKPYTQHLHTKQKKGRLEEIEKKKASSK